MSKTIKREIIAIIKQMEGIIGKEALSGLFDSSDRATGDKRVGCNQFREIASECSAAECYEEIVLLIQYTQAKSKPEQSWKTRCANGKAFGEVVTDQMEQVRALCSNPEDWNSLKEPIQLFFGYLYWQSRIWADAYKQTDSIHGSPKSNNFRQTKRGY